MYSVTITTTKFFVFRRSIKAFGSFDSFMLEMKNNHGIVEIDLAHDQEENSCVKLDFDTEENLNLFIMKYL